MRGAETSGRSLWQSLQALLGEQAVPQTALDAQGVELAPRTWQEHKDPIGRLRESLERLRYRRKVAYWKANGVRFGRGVMIMPTAWLDVSYGWMISIGDRTRISEHVRILVHDASPQLALQYGRVGLVTIGKDCVISERCTILPGVTIGDGCIVGAGSVVTRDLPAGSRAMGVPAHRYGSVEDYLTETRREIDASPRFGYHELHRLDPAQRDQVRAKLAMSGGRAFHREPFSSSPYYVTPP